MSEMREIMYNVKVTITHLPYIQHRFLALEKLSKRVSACYDLRRKGNIVVSPDIPRLRLVTCVCLQCAIYAFDINTYRLGT